MFVIKYRKIFFGLSTLLIVASIGAVAMFGLNYGIEFTGGAIIEVSYEEKVPALEDVESAVVEAGFSARVQETDRGFIIRGQDHIGEERDLLLSALSFGEFSAVEERFNSIGPSIGDELKSKALIAIAVVALAIILFIAYVFRRVSKPVSSWRYGFTATLALIHDITIPVGLFAVLGFYIGAEIDVLFVTALLAILGFSVNDTIVVFDRIRENLRVNEEDNLKEPFDEVVGRSLKQTYVRSINTSLTTLFVLGALYFLGGSVTQLFALVLAVGVIAGTYSSIFLASPIIVELEKWQKRKKI